MLEERINKCVSQESEHLNLHGLGFGDKGAVYLASRLWECVPLEYLSLSDNKIGNEGAIALAQVLPRTHITKLALLYNRISNEGAIALASELPRTCIKTLYLDSNQIGNEGATALASAIQNAPNIIYISLFNNRTDKNVPELIHKALEVNRHNYRRRERTMQDLCLMAIEDTSLVSEVVLTNFEQRKEDNYLLFGNS